MVNSEHIINTKHASVAKLIQIRIVCMRPILFEFQDLTLHQFGEFSIAEHYIGNYYRYANDT